MQSMCILASWGLDWKILEACQALFGCHRRCGALFDGLIALRGSDVEDVEGSPGNQNESDVIDIYI